MAVSCSRTGCDRRNRAGVGDAGHRHELPKQVEQSASELRPRADPPETDRVCLPQRLEHAAYAFGIWGAHDIDRGLDEYVIRFVGVDVAQDGEAVAFQISAAALDLFFV